MDLPSHQEVEIPMPLNSVYAGGAHVHGHGHDHHHQHHHHHEASATQFPALPPSNGQSHENHHEHVVLPSSKKQQQVRYRECQKNHAAAMGGNATDGCGEFMASGEEGSIEALTCSACNCHRNFHRKEVEGELIPFSASPPPLLYDGGGAGSHHHLMLNSRGRKVINLGHHKNMLSPSEAYGGYPPAATAGALVPAGGGSRSVPIIPYSVGPLLIPSDDQSDDQEDAGNGRSLPAPPAAPPHQQHQYYIHHHSNHHHHHHNQMLKKRFRTKFTPEQKEKMLSFAERVGWKIQKQEESVVQQLCQEIGVKRRVLKVWMHNNKHNLAKKNSSTSNEQQQQQQQQL